MNFYLPKRRKPEKLGLRETPQLRSDQHKKWIRGHECSVKDEDCHGRIEAAHCRTGTDGGMSVKPSDNFCIPLCAHHHCHQHAVGEAAFEAKYKIKMRVIADALWAKSPHRKA